MPNKLRQENSPYLLQHANNPVEWYPWGKDAFEKATELDKPIFLSIGYSTCHWCHVMAHESFENEAIAEQMNRSFVNIKVDREERPDIDKYYMSVAQSLTGSGGWPLTIIMTPDKKPFFAATYIPPESRYGRIGIKELIPQISRIWNQEREKVNRSADEIRNFISDQNDAAGSHMIGEDIFKTAFEQFSKMYDAENGGFGAKPKFPSAQNLLFLMRYYKSYEQPKALEIVQKTLQKMSRGGIFDQVGFGFHRYATDKQWKLPHFEKMLYDQSMLLLAYTEAWQITGNVEYEKVVRQTAAYLFSKMRSSEGGFFSAEDADSEGEEGKFYVFSISQLKEILAPSEVKFVTAGFGFSEQGNFLEEATGVKTGNNIFHLQKKFTPEEKQIWEQIRQKLYVEREKRIPPFKDDKVLTDWNGLAVAALAKAGRTLKENKFTIAASEVIDFINENMLENGLLYHSWREGKRSVPGNLDDHAFLIWGLLELYETTLKSSYLLQAIELTDKVIEQFRVPEKGGYYFTEAAASELHVRSRDLYDGAYPSGNSVMFLNLNKLYRYTTDKLYFSEIKAFIQGFGSNISKAPIAFAFFLSGLDMYYNPDIDVIFAGDSLAAIKSFKTKMDKLFLPNSIQILVETDDRVLPEKLPWLRNYKTGPEGVKVYVCHNRQCEAPVTEVGDFINLLKNK